MLNLLTKFPFESLHRLLSFFWHYLREVKSVFFFGFSFLENVDLAINFLVDLLASVGFCFHRVRVFPLSVV